MYKICTRPAISALLCQRLPMTWASTQPWQLATLVQQDLCEGGHGLLAYILVHRCSCKFRMTEVISSPGTMVSSHTHTHTHTLSGHAHCWMISSAKLVLARLRVTCVQSGSGHNSGPTFQGNFETRPDKSRSPIATAVAPKLQARRSDVFSHSPQT